MTNLLGTKGGRLVSVLSRRESKGTTWFQFHSEGAGEWRRKVAIFAELVQNRHPDETVACLEDLSRVLGKHWAYHHRDMIMSFP